jgi:mitochondrial chaperone BCS1
LIQTGRVDVPLLDLGINDTQLLYLLNDAANQSIILFDDVDSAGLARETKNQSMSPLEKTTRTRKKPKPQVTLSGLLNAIDGVESPGGHITIVTTNKLEELDDVLIRSGRISIRTSFRLTSPAQTREIFIRMMQDNFYVATSEETISRANTPEARMLAQLAGDFAENIPANTFSPADLQDYLLMHKTDPRCAVEELERRRTSNMSRKSGGGVEEE